MISSLPSLQAVRQELSRRELIRFVQYTKPDYLAGWFHKKLAGKLDKFLTDVIAKNSPRLIVMAPPRHGKTQLVSRHFPAYALGKFPDLALIATSYASDLASSINRDVQRIIDSEEYGEIFPGASLGGKNVRTVADGSYLRNSDIFEIVNHKGVYKSAGIGAGISGRGGDILLIDDPVKDAAEASSKVVRDSIWDWYTTTLRTRLAPGGGIMLIMTRWHEDDLAGRLIERMQKNGEQWDIIRFPAIAEEDEEFRKVGEALHPERYTLEMLDAIRTGTEDAEGVGSRAWTALYQQRPSAKEGETFKREGWQFMRVPEGFEMGTARERRLTLSKLGIDRVVQCWDTAIGGKEKNDFAACTTLGVGKNKYVALEVWQEKLSYPDMRRAVQMRFDKWTPDVVGVEGGGAAAGKAVIQDLQSDTRIPFKEIITSKDKELRADLLSPTHEAGRCYIIEGATWAADFIDHCAAFPNTKHDDDVDSWMLAMEEAIHGSKRMRISDEFLRAVGA